MAKAQTDENQEGEWGLVWNLQRGTKLLFLENKSNPQMQTYCKWDSAGVIFLSCDIIGKIYGPFYINLCNLLLIIFFSFKIINVFQDQYC